MKRIFIAIILGILSILIAGCSATKKSNYSESEFIGVWMTEDSISDVKQMTDWQKRSMQSSIASMRICEDNVVLYTSAYSANAAATHSYSLDGDTIVVESITLGRYNSNGKTSKGKRVFNISKINNTYQLESEGIKYIKVCDDPYEYDVSKYLDIN